MWQRNGLGLSGGLGDGYSFVSTEAPQSTTDYGAMLSAAGTDPAAKAALTEKVQAGDRSVMDFLRQNGSEDAINLLAKGGEHLNSQDYGALQKALEGEPARKAQLLQHMDPKYASEIMTTDLYREARQAMVEGLKNGDADAIAAVQKQLDTTGKVNYRFQDRSRFTYNKYGYLGTDAHSRTTDIGLTTGETYQFKYSDDPNQKQAAVTQFTHTKPQGEATTWNANGHFDTHSGMFRWSDNHGNTWNGGVQAVANEVHFNDPLERSIRRPDGGLQTTDKKTGVTRTEQLNGDTRFRSRQGDEWSLKFDEHGINSVVGPQGDHHSRNADGSWTTKGANGSTRTWNGSFETTKDRRTLPNWRPFSRSMAPIRLSRTRCGVVSKDGWPASRGRTIVGFR